MHLFIVLLEGELASPYIKICDATVYSNVLLRENFSASDQYGIKVARVTQPSTYVTVGIDR